MQGQTNEDRLELLAKKWLDGSITEEEKQEFSQWYNANQTDEVRIPAHTALDPVSHQAELLKAIKRRTKGEPKRLFPSKKLAIAASILLVVGLGYIFMIKPKTQNIVAAKIVTTLNDKAPGKETAFLIVGNGNKINLGPNMQGTVYHEGNLNVSAEEDGSIFYQQATPTGKNLPDTSTHTIVTPRGGQFRLVLPDQTIVRLNAGSSISYRLPFDEKSRSVHLSGEAYFEVKSHAKHPFTVKTENQEIFVLGTSFNVKAYADEAAETTTLKNGSVSVHTARQSAIQLEPGEKATLQTNINGSLIRSKANVEAELAWVAGYFYFHNSTIEEVMRPIARWYDLDVVYNKKSLKGRYAGKIPRNAQLSDVLKSLGNTGIRYQITGNTIKIF